MAIGWKLPAVLCHTGLSNIAACFIKIGNHSKTSYDLPSPSLSAADQKSVTRPSPAPGDVITQRHRYQEAGITGSHLNNRPHWNHPSFLLGPSISCWAPLTEECGMGLAKQNATFPRFCDYGLISKISIAQLASRRF